MNTRRLVVGVCAAALCGAWGAANALVVDVNSHNNLWYYGNNGGAITDTYQFDSNGNQNVTQLYDGYDHIGYTPVKIDLAALGANGGDTLTLEYTTLTATGWPASYGGPDGQVGGILNGLSTYSVVGAWASDVALDGSFLALDPNPLTVDTAPPSSREFDFVVGSFAELVIPSDAVALFLGINGSLQSEIDLASADKFVSYQYSAGVTASPVPLPAGAWLLLSGLGAFFGSRRLQGKGA